MLKTQSSPKKNNKCCCACIIVVILIVIAIIGGGVFFYNQRGKSNEATVMPPDFMELMANRFPQASSSSAAPQPKGRERSDSIFRPNDGNARYAPQPAPSNNGDESRMRDFVRKNYPKGSAFPSQPQGRERSDSVFVPNNDNARDAHPDGAGQFMNEHMPGDLSSDDDNEKKSNIRYDRFCSPPPSPH